LYRAPGTSAIRALSAYRSDVVKLKMDPQNYKRVYVLDSQRRVWTSSDEGAIWQELTLNLTNLCAQAESLELYSPDATSQKTVLLVGCDSGVYMMRRPGAAGTVWTRLGELPHTLVMDLQYEYSSDALTAATLGRGAWTLSGFFRADTSPPVIVPQISGTLGNNGWYRSNVTVSWSVTDPESGIASSSGCGPTTLTADIAGITLTCTATNGAGLSRAVPVTIKIDKTPPVISGMPAPGCSLWPPNHKFVQVADVIANDALSGLDPSSLKVTGASNEPSDPKDPDIAITADRAGGFVVQLRADRDGNGNGRIYTLTATAADLAGNPATATATCTVPHDQGKN
jgi:hypothetical protein